MARVSYLFDEHMPNALAKEVRKFGIDVLMASEVGLLGAPDHRYFAVALASGRVLVTLDANFLKYHYREMPHAGLVHYEPGTKTIDEMVFDLRLIYEAYDSEAMIGRLEYI